MRKSAAYFLMAMGIVWMLSYTFITSTDAEGNRVDFLGLPYPKAAFSYRARRRATSPHRFSRFGYVHFYLSWGGLIIPFGAGMMLKKSAGKG